MKRAVLFWLLASALLPAQRDSAPVELLGNTFVTNRWNIDGESDRPALAVDAKIGQLWIMHRSIVQIVDIATGKVIDEIKGFHQAQGLAFDDVGQFAYTTDSAESGLNYADSGPRGLVKVVDRRRLQVVATIPLSVRPKNVIFDSGTGLLFVLPDSLVDVDPGWRGQLPNRPKKTASLHWSPAAYKAYRDRTSTMTVIDAEKQKVIGQAIFSGRIDSADSDGTGMLYMTLSDRNRLVSIDETLMAEMLHDSGGAIPILDWTDQPTINHAKSDPVIQYNLAPACTEPTGLVAAGRISRVFVACGNGKLEIFNPAYRQLVATFPIDPTTDTLAYDPERGLIYAPSGNGRLEIVYRHISNDTYAAVLNLPTIPQARTPVLNPDTGEVYLVADKTASDFIKSNDDKIPFIFHEYAGDGFQVLVVGKQ